jgi:hypothetical protein
MQTHSNPVPILIHIIILLVYSVMDPNPGILEKQTNPDLIDRKETIPLN